MDRESILDILEILGADNVLPHARNVQCSCVLARWEHPKGSDSRPSMGISIDDRGPSLVNCFACGYKGTMETLVQRIQRYRTGDDMTELLARVADLEELQLDAMLERVPEYESREASMDECVLPEVYLENYRGLAHPYVLKRGFDLDTLRAWEIGYDEEQKRVVMPVRNRGRQLVGAVGRGVGRNPRPKYLNYWKFEKGLYLFGEHLVTEGAVVVVEGPLDALRVWQEFAKVKRHVNVVALMGAKATWKQCEKLTRLTDQLVLFLDNDAAGWEGQTDLVKKLRKTMLITAVRYPDVIDGDPDTLGAEVVAMIDNADLLV